MGDLFMSLIHHCELNGVNSFHYLTELQRHAADVKSAAGRLDAVELWRDSGADEIPGCESLMGWSAIWPKKDRLRPMAR